ncbi:Threonine aldolase [Cerrena zonata]|uniref:Threonine aldolase n=1 Tax=Cerrena zonata TaxID=2478898 RepID=A0AAW0GC56_9APHY
MTVISEEEFPTTHNDFRSDTFTVPTQSMIEQITHQLSSGEMVLGDAVYQEDRATFELEEFMTELTGKQLALFCSSVMCDHRSHVFLHEAGGLASLSQAMVHPIKPLNGDYLTFEDILENFTEDEGDIHAAPTKVISLENTLHGIIIPLEEIKKISYFCNKNNVKLHLDGARIWNAHIETGISIKEYCSYFDSVSLCLSKSLGAPMGSILVGTSQFIEKANHFKKQCGGGIRQGGIMCKMAETAIKENISKLKKSHDYAKQIDHDIKLESPVDTSFVFIDLKKNKMDPSLLVEIGSKYNVKLMGGRVACHFQISQESVDNLKSAILECYKESLIHPYEKNYGIKLYNFDTIKIRQKQHY